MRIKSTLAWGALLLASAVGGAITGNQGTIWHSGQNGTYGAYVGLRYDSCPDSAPGIVPTIVGCPITPEPLPEGDLLTPGQVEAVAMEAPGTDPATCRAVVGDTTVITCQNGTVITS